MSRPSVVVVFALFSIVVALVGCGQSSSSKTRSPGITSTTAAASTTNTSAPSPSGALTRAELIAKADAICAGANARFGSLKVTSTAELGHALAQEGAFNRVQAVELSKLIPPASMSSDWKLIVDGVRRLGSYATKLSTYTLTNNSTAGPPLLLASSRDRNHILAIAKRDGFRECPPV
jgi:hypothetical protein